MMHFFWLTYVFHVPFTCSICRYVLCEGHGFQATLPGVGGHPGGGRARALDGPVPGTLQWSGRLCHRRGSHDGSMSHITAIVCVAMVPNMVTGGPFFEYWENQLITFNYCTIIWILSNVFGFLLLD